MRDYWLSTPKWTVWVRVGERGKIVECAPILRKRWRGDLWPCLLNEAERVFGKDAVRYERIAPAQVEML